MAFIRLAELVFEKLLLAFFFSSTSYITMFIRHKTQFDNKNTFQPLKN